MARSETAAPPLRFHSRLADVPRTLSGRRAVGRRLIELVPYAGMGSFFILVAALVLIAAGGLVGWLLGLSTRRTQPPVKLALHLGLLALSLVPLALHVLHSARTAATFGAPAIEPIGMVPQLRSAMIGAFALIAVVFAIGAIASRYAPVLAAAAPAVAFTAYYVFILPAFSSGAVLASLDNLPVIWLFLYEAAFCVTLAVHAIVGRVATSFSVHRSRAGAEETDARAER